jgi:hypothetical protein
MRSSPDKFCDGRTDVPTDRRRRGDLYIEATQKGDFLNKSDRKLMSEQFAFSLVP